MAVESNRSLPLIFEEPESHAFPEYTKKLGEKIVLDGKNQYFLATHNPYLLLSIVEKAKKDVNVFITYLEDYTLRVKGLDADEIRELIEYDPQSQEPQLRWRSMILVECNPDEIIARTIAGQRV